MDKKTYKQFAALHNFSKAVGWSTTDLKRVCLWTIALIDSKSGKALESAFNSIECVSDFFIEAHRVRNNIPEDEA